MLFRVVVQENVAKFLENIFVGELQVEVLKFWKFFPGTVKFSRLAILKNTSQQLSLK